MKKPSLPDNLVLKLKRYKSMRYGENPHQQSAYYLSDGKPGWRQIAGIELSHNNLGDANHAWRLVCDFSEPTVAIIKHGNPSGIATRSDLAQAFSLAYEADKMSAFGGIIAVNRPPTLEMVEAMGRVFFELLVAPAFTKDVLERLKKRSQKMRLVEADQPKRQLEFTRVFAGYLVQTPDDVAESKSKWKVISGEEPSRGDWEDMEFAWKVVKHVRSNAIVIVRDKAMIGMGTGQPNRVNSTKLALSQAKDKAKGAILASDAFFPFPDNVRVAARAGIRTIIQPGGSINDENVVEEAKKRHIAMVFTGVRHFKH